jgi:hypothetical protein
LKDAVKRRVTGFVPEQFLEGLSTYLQQMGIDAEAVSPGSPEEIGAYSYQKNIGCFTVKGRNFDMVQGNTWSGESDRIFSLDFVVRGNVSRLEKQLEAEAKEQWKGFTRRGDKITDVTWKGGRLADLLNGDRDLKDLLIHANGWLASPWIHLDQKNQCVRIGGIVESTEVMGFTDNWTFPSKAYVEACDRIAQHVRTLL